MIVDRERHVLATPAAPGLPGATTSRINAGDFASASARACSRPPAADDQNVHRRSFAGVGARTRDNPLGGGLSNFARRGQTLKAAQPAEPGFDRGPAPAGSAAFSRR